MAEDKNWIKGAIKRPGALTRKAALAAKRADKPITKGTTMEFARKMKGAPGRTGRQARLAITLGKMRKA